MDRKQRMATRKNRTVCRLNESARALDMAMKKAGVNSADKESFLNWTISSLWRTFKEERMNERITIENEVRKLGLRFPNGTVKKEYNVFFELPIDKIHDIEFLGAEELGLIFNIDKDGKCSLSGKPQSAGDFSFKLRFKTVDGEPESELSFPVAFNPNPRELWTKKPTDKATTRFYKPDSECEYLKVRKSKDDCRRKDIVAASQRGRSHAHEGSPRDDHFSIYHCEKSDWYILAVADGAGSAKYSRRGSELACQTVVDYCKDNLLDNQEFETVIREYAGERENKDKRTAVTRWVIDIVYKGAVKAHEALKKETVKEELNLKDLGTTLMFAICKKYDFGWFIASFWVGDGAMCIIDTKNKTAKLLGTPDEGEFSGQTRFLTMPEIFRDPAAVSKRLRMAIVPDFTALLLMTDGVSDPMFETENNLNDFAMWEMFYENLKQGFPEDEIGGVDLTGYNEASKDQLLGWLDFWSPGNHDDRTIAILF